MKKYFWICFFVSIIVLIFASIFLLIAVNNNNTAQETKSDAPYEYTEEDFERLKGEYLSLGKWTDVTESDKLNFAFGSESATIKRVTSALEKNSYVICYVVGGRFNTDNSGAYIILSGFSNEGKVKVLSSINNNEEKEYIYERIFENVNKVMLFDGGVVTNE